MASPESSFLTCRARDRVRDLGHRGGSRAPQKSSVIAPSTSRAGTMGNTNIRGPTHGGPTSRGWAHHLPGRTHRHRVWYFATACRVMQRAPASRRMQAEIKRRGGKRKVRREGDDGPRRVHAHAHSCRARGRRARDDQQPRPQSTKAQAFVGSDGTGPDSCQGGAITRKLPKS